MFCGCMESSSAVDVKSTASSCLRNIKRKRKKKKEEGKCQSRQQITMKQNKKGMIIKTCEAVECREKNRRKKSPS